MVIGLLLLTGTASMFISNKRIYKEQDEMGRLQENARFAMQMLIEDIRMASYTGCMDDIDEVTNGLAEDISASPIVTITDAKLLSFTNGIEGLNDADPSNVANSPWEPSNGDEQVSTMVTDTDAITVRYLRPVGVSLASAMGSPTSNIVLDNNTVGLAVGDLVGVTDCDSTDIIQISALSGTPAISHTVTGAPGNMSTSLSKAYTDEAEVARFVARRYYISTGAAGFPSLFRIENNDAAVELIEGVENMQVLYGEDTTNDDTIADVYRDADTVANWDNVVSLRIALLFMTTTTNVSNPINDRDYDLVGVTYTAPSDRARRRVVTNTIQIRNRSNQL